MRSILIAPLCALVSAVVSSASAQPYPGPSAREVVEFEKIIQPYKQNDDVLKEQVSPDGTQAFIVTRKSDVASDKNVYRIQLLDVTPAHLATQHVPKPVTIFSMEAAGDNDFWAPAVQEVQWHGERTLVFMARLGGESYQVYRLDVPSRELLRLTHEKDSIVSYAVSQDLQRVVYAVQVPNPPLREGAHGVIVGHQSFWSVKFGQNDLLQQDRIYQYVVADVGLRRAPRVLGRPFPEANIGRPTVSISPDGRWALLPRYEPERLEAWARQYPLIEEFYEKFTQSSNVDPLKYFSTPGGFVPRRMTAWRLDDGKEQTIVDAPDDARTDLMRRGDCLWQGRGTSVVLAGTHLPPARDGKTSSASHIIEYWPDSGKWIDIAALEGRFKEAHPLRDGFVVSDDTRRREFHRQPDGGWRESAGGAQLQPRSPGWTLHIAQGLNQPADVYASGPSGQTTRLTWLNPQFKQDTWGVMQPYAWRDGAGRQWEGGLMAANDLDMHARHPLLIQTYGFSPDRFYLDGPNVGEGYTSGFAGRAFLREGILVLAMPWAPNGGFPSQEHQALQIFNAGVRGAIDALVKAGRVDPSRIGIIGFSSTGARVLNLITFDDVPIRAATTADGDANTLFEYTVSYGRLDLMWVQQERLNEALPFGDSRARWIDNDPAMHTDCVHTALRIESYGPTVEPNWDIYALLRRQLKPVEMVVLPGGLHSLQTPGDRMVSLQGNVDWYAFWLQGRTRATPVMAAETSESLAEQFARWREMETLKTADDARPRCIR